MEEEDGAEDVRTLGLSLPSASFMDQHGLHCGDIFVGVMVCDGTVQILQGLVGA